MANPYHPVTEATSDSIALGRNDCPVCRSTVNRFRLAVPLLKCPRCGTRLFLRLPIPIAASWLAVMLALLFVTYRWFSADPMRLLDHVWLVSLLPAPLVLVSLIPFMLAFGRPCANNGLRNLTHDEIEGRRNNFLRLQNGG